MIRMTTAGESHGKGLFAILEGIPAGLELNIEEIDARLALRQSGYGRGVRQKIESDKVEILSGVRNRVTLGSPIALAVWNRDYENWKHCMAPEGCDAGERRLTKVRPGHADLAGMCKFGQDDARNILERASARETAVRVAAGEICRQFLAALGIEICGFVRSVGSVSDEKSYTYDAISKRSPLLGMIDTDLEREACALIDRARKEGDTLGGVVELRVRGLKAGFGSCMTYAEKLDARLTSALMSVQAVKGVEVGLGFASARSFGSSVHDEILPPPAPRHPERSEGSRGTQSCPLSRTSPFMPPPEETQHMPPPEEGGRGVGNDLSRAFTRRTNNAGGIEGGMSNGEELVLRAAMKPIPTVMKGLRTVDTDTLKPTLSAPERSDVCAVFACETVCEAAIAAELAKVVSERLGGDTMAELMRRNGELQ